MISEEQIEEIKKQLIQQAEAALPDDKKEIAKQQIISMNSEQLEEFLQRNNMTQKQGNKCIFCSIVFGETPSYKIGENEKALAVLEINPISHGHVLIIPKSHELLEKIPKEIPELVKEITGKIKSQLKPRDIKASNSKLFNHEIINLLPIYENETFNSERQQATKEELEELQKTLSKSAGKKTTRMKKPKIEKIKPEKFWLPKRIP